MELRRIATLKDSQYKKVRELGKGGGGVVYLKTDKKENRDYAVKSIGIDKTIGIKMEALREMKYLKEVANADHPNIIKMSDAYISKGHVNIVIEYCNGDLNALIKNKDIPITIPHMKTIMSDILESLQFCHSRYLAHRDIKPDNYLVGFDKCLKLTDFGLSRLVGTPREKYTFNVFTDGYRAPELLMESPLYTSAVDIWAAGCIFSMLITRVKLFFGRTADEGLYEIFSLLGTPSDDYWPVGVYEVVDSKEMKSFPGYIEFSKVFSPRDRKEVFPNMPEDLLDLLYKMLEMNPAKRITAKEALNHPFFCNSPEKTPHNQMPYDRITNK